ncbi:hypothetical protein TNCV_2827191 [Trichonephila clavipes]|nr:hypothetical protein TNCV_2827191 [Trichonephila clavipes]
MNFSCQLNLSLQLSSLLESKTHYFPSANTTENRVQLRIEVVTSHNRLDDSLRLRAIGRLGAGQSQAKVA